MASRVLLTILLGVLTLGSWSDASEEYTQDDIDALHRELCPRIFVKGLDGGKIAHLQLLGVYAIQNVTWSDLPVYKHEQENLYIYVSTSQKILHVGKQGLPAPVLFAHLKYFNISRAISQTDKHPYYDMVDEWFTYDPVKKSHIPIPGSDLTLECVDDDFVLCRSTQLTFRGKIPFAMRNIQSGDDVPNSWISDVTDISFYMFDGGFKNMRPVYEVLGFYNVLFLYYNGEGVWEISDDWISNSFDKFVVFRVFDTALRPEYITGQWELNQNGTFYGVPTIRLRCHGNPAGPDGACTENYPCYNSAICKYVEHTSVSGEILCLCGPNHQGPVCRDETPSCTVQDSLVMPDNALFYSTNGHQLGDVMTYFCFPESAEMFFFSKCESKKPENGTMETAWVFHGNCDLDNSATSITGFSTLLMPSLLFFIMLTLH